MLSEVRAAPFDFYHNDLSVYMCCRRSSSPRLRLLYFINRLRVSLVTSGCLLSSELSFSRRALRGGSVGRSSPVSQSVSQSVTTTLLAGSTWPTLTLHSGLLSSVRRESLHLLL